MKQPFSQGQNNYFIYGALIYFMVNIWLKLFEFLLLYSIFVEVAEICGKLWVFQVDEMKANLEVQKTGNTRQQRVKVGELFCAKYIYWTKSRFLFGQIKLLMLISAHNATHNALQKTQK